MTFVHSNMHCTLVWSAVLPTNEQFDVWLTPNDPCLTFDLSNALHFGQGFFLPNLLAIGISQAVWPLIDPCWPLNDLQPSNALGSSDQIWWQYGISKADWHLDDLWPLMGSLRKYAFKPCGPVPYPHAKFQLDTSKHDKIHRWTYILIHTHPTPTHPHTQTLPF